MINSHKSASPEELEPLLPKLSGEELAHLKIIILNKLKTKVTTKRENNGDLNPSEKELDLDFIDDLRNKSSDARHIINIVAQSAEYGYLSKEYSDQRSTHRALSHALDLFLEVHRKTGKVLDKYRLLISPNATLHEKSNNDSPKSADYHWLDDAC
ncbi:hypothetical protein ACVBE9_01025 [Eionea flava]